MRWKADQVQGVFFTLPGGEQPDALDVWKIISNSTSPESYQRPGISPIAQSHASGLIEESHVTLSCQLGRIDVFLAPRHDDFSAETPPQFETINSPLNTLEKVMNLFSKSYKTNRIAIVCNLSIHTKSTEEAAKLISIATKVEFPKQSTDQIYQFNVRKQYENSPDHQMNRVITYTVGNKQMISGHINLENGQPIQSAMPVVVIPIINLKLDFNSATKTDVTDAAPSMIADQISEIFRAVQNAEEILDA